MKTQFILLILTILLTGCTLSSKVDAVRNEVNQRQFKDLNDQTQFSVSYPAPHSGAYQTVEQLNFVIKNGKFREKNASALLAKPHHGRNWVVLTILVEHDGHWIKLPKQQNHSSSTH